jgi:hypothetical protein
MWMKAETGISTENMTSSTTEFATNHVVES